MEIFRCSAGSSSNRRQPETLTASSIGLTARSPSLQILHVKLYYLRGSRCDEDRATGVRGSIAEADSSGTRDRPGFRLLDARARCMGLVRQRSTPTAFDFLSALENEFRGAFSEIVFAITAGRRKGDFSARSAMSSHNLPHGSKGFTAKDPYSLLRMTLSRFENRQNIETTGRK